MNFEQPSQPEENESDHIREFSRQLADAEVTLETLAENDHVSPDIIRAARQALNDAYALIVKPRNDREWEQLKSDLADKWQRRNEHNDAAA